METKVTFIFTKMGKMRFISHLDLMRTFMRALRRADIPLKISQGFNPHPKLSIKRAIKLGVESQEEEASIVLKETIALDDFKNRLNECLPQGIQIKGFLN
jgi:radical SAM-linked protein